MAHLQDILIDAGNIVEEVLEIHGRKEEHLLQSYFAAQTIQKYLRGHLVRKHMKMLHRKTTIIQKHWRGFLGRQLYFKLLKETAQERCKQKFNKCATKIQKVWKGYLTRKYIFDYYLYKEWMKNVKRANKYMIDETEKEMKSAEESSKLDREKEANATLQCILFKAHHLLRTYHRKGVLSKKGDTKEYSFTEELLRSFHSMSYMKKQKEDKAKKETEQKKDSLTNDDVEFTFEKIKRLKRDCIVKNIKEKGKTEQEKKKEKVIEKKKLPDSSKKRTEDCKCCTMPNYRQ